jgi:hypothetical protein
MKVPNKKVLTLQLDAGRIDFILKSFDEVSYFFDFDIECVLDKKYSLFYPKNNFCTLHVNDCNRLIEYFKNHHKQLVFNKKSPIFMALDAGFQLQCCMKNTDENFFLSIFFNSGSSRENESDCYFGFLSAISIKNAIRFIHEIENLLHEQCGVLSINHRFRL